MASENSTLLKNKLEWALWWASKGFHIFPVNGKIPLIKDWPDLAITDIYHIQNWWADWPEADIGCHPDRSGHFVIDIDVKGKENGYETIAAFEREHGPLPPTFTTNTPSGGQHLWYKGHANNSVRALGPGLDVRGQRGFVLLGGSVSVEGGHYEASSLEPDISVCPPWLMARLAERESSHTPERSTLSTEELDLPHNVARGIRLMERSPTRYQGDGCDARTLEMAMWLKDMGVSPEKSLELMIEHYKCEPKDNKFEAFAERKIAHAWKYGKNEPGSKALSDPNSLYGGVVENEENITHKKDVLKFKAQWVPEQDQRQPPEWLIDKLIPEGAQCLIYGSPGSYKSFVALDFALSVATGLDTFGIPVKAGPVLYVAGEGALGIAKTRRPAWMLSKGIVDIPPFALLDLMPFVGAQGDVERMIKDIKAQEIKPRLIVFDTLARMAAGMDENSARDMGMLLTKLSLIQRELSTTVLVVHHSGKDDSKGARGSSALLAGFDTVLHVRANNETKTAVVANGGTYGKQKDAEPHPDIFLKGQEFMGALVFSQVPLEEAKAAAISQGAVLRKEVFTALTNLKAYGLSNPQKTRGLATQILADRGHDQEEPGYKLRLESCERSLKRLGTQTGRLAGFCTHLDGTRVWHLPETTDEIA